LDFYFDFISPYAYFAWKRIQNIADAAGRELAVHPVLLAGMLDHWGQLGPAEVEPKRRFTSRDVARYAIDHNLPLRGPAQHPFHPLAALRAVLVAGDDAATAITALFDAGWGRGIDMADPAQLAAALSDAGLDGPALLAGTQDPAIKQRLREKTEAAIAAGVFGVPTVVVDGELYWGNDRLHYVERALKGDDPLAKRSGLLPLEREAGATRPGARRSR
jgi:2-hydroxychromene-2-carboxylate isomerase